MPLIAQTGTRRRRFMVVLAYGWTWLIVCLLALPTAHTLAQTAATQPDISNPAGAFYILDPSGSLLPLEKVTGQMQPDRFTVSGGRSSIRFPAGSNFKFDVKLPPGSRVRLLKLDADAAARFMPLAKTSDGKVTIAEGDPNVANVAIELVTSTGGVATLATRTPLHHGEYCIGVSNTQEGYCFGLDPSPQEAAIPAVAPPSTAHVTEPTSDNVVFYVDPAGNQLPLEYNVPFRLGFSSFLVTKREQAIVRFPQGSPLRFIARVPAGKTADFMQLDPRGGWRQIPIGWAGKTKGSVNPRDAKQARMVSFTPTPVGSAQLMTPDEALVPGEYCFNLHSEEWFCFGIDASSGAPEQASAASSGGSGGMTNADVIKMASAGLSADLIVSTIHSSASHSFDLSIDNLIALKKAGVPDAAVAAMQMASTPAPGPNGGPATTHIADSKIPTPPEASAFYSVSPSGRLTMLEVGKPDIVDGRTTLVDGDQVYYQLFGARSPVRFTDGSPTIVIKMPPKDKGFFGSMDKDNQFGDLYDMQLRRWEPTTGKREARFNTRAPRIGEHYDPEPGTFDFAIMKIGTGLYKIVPVDPLVPGEYCTGLHRLPTDVERLYCFGIDGPR